METQCACVFWNVKSFLILITYGVWLPSLFSVNDFKSHVRCIASLRLWNKPSHLAMELLLFEVSGAVNSYWMISKQSCSDARPVLNFTHDICFNVTYLSSSVHLWQPKQLQWLHHLLSSAAIIAGCVCLCVLEAVCLRYLNCIKWV